MRSGGEGFLLAGKLSVTGYFVSWGCGINSLHKYTYSKSELMLFIILCFSFIDVSAQNKRRVSDGENSIGTLLTNKKEYYLEYKSNLPLGAGGNGMGKDNLLIQSILTKYQEGLKPGMYMATQAFSSNINSFDTMQVYRVGCYNCPLTDLFRQSYADNNRIFNLNRISFEVQDPSKIINKKSVGGEYVSWLRAGNAFTYELVLPFAMGRKAVYDRMKFDLKMAFPQYNVTVDKRTVECLLLKRINDVDLLTTKGGKPFVDFSPFGFTMKNAYTLGYFIERLDYYMQNDHPIIDLTGLTVKVDLTIQAKLSNLKEVNIALASYGLILERGKHKIDMLIISDSGKAALPFYLDPLNYDGRSRNWDWEKIQNEKN